MRHNKVIARIDIGEAIPAKQVLSDGDLDINFYTESGGGWWDSYIFPTPEDHATYEGEVGEEDSGFWKIGWHGNEYVVCSIDLDYALF